MPSLTSLLPAALAVALLLPGPAVDARPLERGVPGVSGCSTSGRLEVCFSSPPTEGHSDAAVINRLRGLFQAAGPGDALRVAMFRWEIAQAADDLLAAQRRGALVEIVADHDVETNRVGRSLLRKVERRDTRRDNVVVCRGACLPWRAPGPPPGGQDVNHLKVVLADLGGERSLTSTSSNLARRQFHQYNSLVRVTDERLYAFGLEWWQRLRKQSLRADGETWDDRDKYFAGPPAASIHPRRADLVLSTLRRVRCVPGMRQVDVMVAVIQRHDVRRRLGLLHRDGCRVRVVVDRESIENWMQARVRLADGTVVDLPDKKVRTVSNHDKVYAIHARLGGRERWVVLTGTSNTTCGGLLYNDEIMFRIGGEWVQHRYAAHFRDAFARAHQSPHPRAVPTLSRCRA